MRKKYNKRCGEAIKKKCRITELSKSNARMTDQTTAVKSENGKFLKCLLLCIPFSGCRLTHDKLILRQKRTQTHTG